MTDRKKIEKAIILLDEIHSEIIISEGTLKVNELMFLIGKVYGVLEK